METEGAGEEGAHGSTDDAAANEEGADAYEAAGEDVTSLVLTMPSACIRVLHHV